MKWCLLVFVLLALGCRAKFNPNTMSFQADYAVKPAESAVWGLFQQRIPEEVPVALKEFSWTPHEWTFWGSRDPQVLRSPLSATMKTSWNASFSPQRDGQSIPLEKADLIELRNRLSKRLEELIRQGHGQVTATTYEESEGLKSRIAYQCEGATGELEVRIHGAVYARTGTMTRIEIVLKEVTKTTRADQK